MVTKPYLWQHPSGRWYFRRLQDGQMRYIRIKAEPETAEFDRLYWEIRSGKRAEAKRSWSALIAAYRETDKWAELSPRYRQDIEKVFAYLEEKIGRQDVARLTQPDIMEAMDANRHRARFANYIPTAISMLSKLAIRKRWRLDNPAVGDLEQIKVPKDRKQPHVPWPDWAVELMRSEGRPVARLIFEIGVGSVQRPGDWVGFTWGDYDGERLKLRQNKTGVPLELPCTEFLKAALDEERARLAVVPHPSRTILAKPDGSPMSYNDMARIMLAERKRLDLTAFDQHALRYRGVMELALAGCDDDEIASYTGHTTKAMIVKYAGEARQKMRAKQAAAKRR
ncbi:MAG: tyrosine-type recombinase/integrase [Thioclava marina]|uniref:site-specific integrase n=1 Tax=Thioclava marina TaxID=1915077 RepID=UPI0019A54EF3|nr:tyrosine-type recombinase/integrase [Thioclava marina]MBC7146759.1 tyrosine-type recombinase/integrase [Thioclava marina]